MSPLYFFTRSAWRLRQRLRILTTSSGAHRSDNGVKPRMSEKKIVLTTRSPPEIFFCPLDWIMSTVDCETNFCMSSRSRSPRIITLKD